jgi:DNA-binding NarL/FixJ family response regulator
MLTSQVHEPSLAEFTLDGLLAGSFRLVELVRDDAVCRAVLRRERPPGRLTARERSVIERLIAGSSQKTVSFDLGVALTTVSVHLRVALDKLGIRRWEHAVLAGCIVAVGGDRAVESGSGAKPGPLDPDERLAVAKVELAPDSLAALTSAEREVALLVVDGLTNAEIGVQRRSSPRTVANQIASVFRKLGVHGRLELIRSLALGAPAGRVVRESGVRALEPAAPERPAALDVDATLAEVPALALVRPPLPELSPSSA